MKIGKKYIPPLVLLMVSMSATAYAIPPLFTQNGPAIPIKGVAAQCTALTPNTPGVLPGSVGAVVFDCSPVEFGANAPAFSVAAGTTKMTPMYTTTCASGCAFPTSTPGYSGCTGVTGASQASTNAPSTVGNAFCIIPSSATTGEFSDTFGSSCQTIAQLGSSSSLSAYVIQSGVQFTFTAAGSWNYCVEYSVTSGTPASMPSFTIQWF